MGPVGWHGLMGGGGAHNLKPKDLDSHPISTIPSWAHNLASLHLSLHICRMGTVICEDEMRSSL